MRHFWLNCPGFSPKSSNRPTSRFCNFPVKSIYGMNLQSHNRKQAQMHSVANELARKYQRWPFSVPHHILFKCCCRKCDGRKIYQGKFTKYVNNDGKTRDGDSELSKKAESLCHFSYVATNEKLLLVDIQGFGYTLCDPEIATPSIMDDSEFQFCLGNSAETTLKNDIYAISIADLWCWRILFFDSMLSNDISSAYIHFGPSRSFNVGS